ncbi:MAG: hypothetical protein WC156_00935 [Pedobacter sp.]
MCANKLKAIFSESQVMMLVEEFNSNLKLISEGIASIDKKIDAVEARLSLRIDAIATRLGRVESNKGLTI